MKKDPIKRLHKNSIKLDIDTDNIKVSIDIPFEKVKRHINKMLNERKRRN